MTSAKNGQNMSIFLKTQKTFLNIH